jgi:hypothetical protein
MGVGHRICAFAAVLGLAALAPGASAATRHGTRVASGPVESETGAQMMRQGSTRHGPRHGLRARRGEPDKQVGSGPSTSVSAPAGEATGPKTSFGSTFNFDGPSFNDTPGFFPPDTQGAVGPSQFLVTINGSFRSFSKSTGLADGGLDVDPDVFFSGQLSSPPSGGIVFTSDPHVRYDRLSQRWFIVMIDAPLDSSGNASKANRILIAHSDGPTLSPSTVWTKTFIQVSGAFADYPTLGVDANALYVGTNNFATSGQFAYTGTSGYVISKASVLANGALTATKFALVANANGGGPFTPQGADNPDAGATQGYFVGVDNQFFSLLDVVRTSDPGGTPSASASLGVTVPTTAFPLSVPHQGNTGGTNGQLDALDDRLFAASIRDNKLWTAHNIQVNAAGVGSSTGGRDGSRWYELNLGTTPTLVQSGTVFDPAASNPLSYWIPTVAVSGQGHMAIGGSAAGAAHHVDAWFSGRLSSDTAGALDAPTFYTASNSAYNPPGDPGPTRRWGDYSAVSLDPTDDMTMWAIQEYVPATNSWGTRIARLRAPGPATPSSVSPRVLLGQASVSATLTGSTLVGRGFFDPGPGFTRPQVSVGCGVTVTGLTVNSPSQASLTLDTTAATDTGPCNVTFTNPDGQTASAAVLGFEHAPTAVDDVASVVQDTVLHGASVLANDSDPDGDLLSASKASDPAHGTVTVNGSGTFTYTPAAGYVGPDSFTYTVSDGTLQDTGTVSITVTGDHAPVAQDDAYAVAQDTVLHGSSVLANDSDPDGDALTASKASDPGHGAATKNADGTFTYTPAAGYSGPDFFTYTVSDGARTDTGMVSIAVTPAAPVIQLPTPPGTPAGPGPGPGTPPPTVTKLTLHVKKLRGKRLRVRVSGAGPTGARVRVVVLRGKRRAARKTVTVVNSRWKLTIRLTRHGGYRFKATAGSQHAASTKRL